MSETVLAVVGHPDDESFLMGGALAKLAKDGKRVVVVALSDGVGSRFFLSDGPDRLAAKIRRQRHYEVACRELGADPRYVEAFLDQQSDAVLQLEINRAVERLVMRYLPSVVYTHSVYDLNVDHRRVAEAVRVATRGRCEVHEAEGEWPERMFANSAWWSCVDITETMDIKVRACQAYEDEMREPPHPRSVQEIRKRTEERFLIVL